MRHLHTAPIPRLGGVAIFLSFIMVTGLLSCISLLFRFHLDFSPYTVLQIFLPSVLVFSLGLYDDVRPISPYAKFLVQGLAAGLLFFGGFKVFQLPLFGAHELSWLALPLTIIWVIGITNAFNLIDGLDGLAAGSALFSTITVFVVSLLSDNHLVSLLTITLAGAILGFLRFNFNPATIFLGDCGSLFIGFMLSALALVGTQKTPTIVAVAIPVVSFGLPILDTTLAVARRFLSGKPLFTADRGHIHHKLLERGFTHPQVVIILYGVSALFGLLSLFLLYPEGGAVGIVLVVLGVGVWLGVQQLRYPEFVELGRAAQSAIVRKQMIINNLAIRRAIQKLSQANDFSQLCWILQEAFESNDFDGFQLNLNIKNDRGVQIMNESSESLRNERCWIWYKTSKDLTIQEDPGMAWTLTLELLNAKKERQGFLALHRINNDRPLLVDINLITSEFHVALARAVDNALNREV